MPPAPNRPPAVARWLLAIGFGLLGLALNAAPVEVFSGIYLLLGHPAVVAAAVLLGPAGGALAGAIAGSITPIYWSHPWAVTMFAVEGLVLGLWCRRLLPAVASVAFWLLAAVPYGLALGLEYPSGTAIGIVIKTVAEATLAALVVQVAVLAPKLHRLVRPLLPPPLLDVRARTTVRSVVLLASLFPLVVLGVANSRLVYARRLAEVDQANLARADSAADAVSMMIERTRAAVVEAASADGDPLALLLLREPLIRGAALVANGRIVRSASRRPDVPNVLGEVVRLPPGRAFDVVDVAGSDRPLVVVSTPYRGGGQLVASLDLEQLDRALAARARTSSRLFLLDARGRVVAATPGAVLDDLLRHGIAAAGEHGTSAYLTQPPPPRSLRPRATERVAVSTAEPFDLRVVFDQSQAAVQPQIDAEALGMFGGFCAAVVAALAAGLILVRVVVGPVDDVARATRRLRRGEQGARVDGLMADAPRELRQLGDGFDRMADEVERQLVAVERATRARDEFLSIASHELKTPLAILKTQMQLVQRRPKEIQERQLRLIARQLDRITRLVNQLLDASSLGPGAIPLDRKELELSEVIRRIVGDLRAVAPDRELRLELEEVRGRWDELRIEQVLHNLIGNALKFSPAGEPVEVALRARAGGGAELRVSDRGIGIVPGDMPKLFQRFSRGSSPAGEGLGVGLYVVRRIVERHGGTVSLTPREGGGTVATVLLPEDGQPPDAPGERRGVAFS